RRPEFVGPTVVFSSWQQQSFQLPELVIGQAGRGTELGPRLQAVWLSSAAQPAGQTLGMDSEDTGDRHAGFALRDQGDGAEPPSLQFSSCANGSTHTKIRCAKTEKGTLPRLEPVVEIDSIPSGDHPFPGCHLS